MNLRVKVVVPSGIFLEQVATKVVAEALNGSFCLLPQHVDFVAALIPGILAVTGQDGTETFLAVDEGILVKQGPEVRISTGNAVRGKLGELQSTVHKQFRDLNESEQKARLALDRLEASMVRQILEWEGRGHA